MNARHAARELVILTLSQSRISKKDVDNLQLQDFIEQAVRALTGEVNQLLDVAKGDLIHADDQLVEASFRDNPESIKEFLSNSLYSTQKALELVAYCNELPLLCTLAMRDEVRDFSIKLINIYREHQKEVNEIIEKSIVDWTLESIYSVDRNVIAIAVVELLYEKTSPKIIIDEAVEIAKKYGSEDSGGFVNGVLNRILNTLGLETKSTDNG
jgi:N utilization substance protein B